MRRVLRCDGIIPQFGADSGGPEGLRAVRAWLARQGAREGLDVVVDGETPAGEAAAAATQVRAMADAGATWWLETRWGTPDNMPERVQEMTDWLAACLCTRRASPAARSETMSDTAVLADLDRARPAG